MKNMFIEFMNALNEKAFMYGFYMGLILVLFLQLFSSLCIV